MIDKVLRVGIKVNPSENKVGIKVRDDSARISIKVSQGNGGSGRLPAYDGDYEITPRKKEIVLPTKNKSMLDDVTVFQIPYAEVPNLTGGLTVTIGLE